MPDRAAIPSEFAHEYERARARILRRRALWYCFAVFALLTLSICGSIIDMFDPESRESPARLALEGIGDLAIVLIHAVGATLLLKGPVTRRRVVKIVCWMMFLAGAVAVIQTQLDDNSDLVAGATTEITDEAVMARGIATLIAVFLLHFIASMLVTLSPREGLRPLLPLLAIFAVSVLVQAGASLGVRLAVIGLSPLAGLPGFLFSWWRHRSFSERFGARVIARRYDEVTSDLAGARRLHESLFPQQIGEGPIRLRYVYEPARHIGGDYLFVHRSRSPGSSALTAVVIDVTGHGVSAALAVNRIHGELQRVFASAQGAPPDRVIASLNTFACDALAPQRVYATALCLEVTARDDAETASVAWSSAGHPAAMLRRGDGRVESLASTSPILGALPPDEFDPGCGRTTLSLREVLIAVTDGAIESRDERGEEIGSAALGSLIASLLSDEAIADSVVSRLTARRNATPTDDTLVVEIRLG